MSKECIFCKIASGDIPTEKVHEDEFAIAFKDIKPIAPTHLLVVPKKHFASLGDVPPDKLDIMSKLFAVVQKVAKAAGLADGGYRTIVNTGRAAGQEVFHLHIHLVGGRQLGAMG